MINKKLICTDLDGTLLFRKVDNEGKTIMYVNDVDREALHNLQKAGHVIAIVTGRQKKGIRSFLQESKIAFDYYVGTNGSLLMNQHFEVLEQSFIPSDVVKDIIAFVKDDYPEIGVMATNGFNTCYFGHTFENAQVQFDPDAEKYTFNDYDSDTHHFIMMNVNLLDDKNPRKTEIMDKVEAALKERFSTRMNIFRNQDFIDFAPLGNSKGNAVKHIAEKLSIPLEDVYTIGDSWNDLSMFKIGSHAYTFEHADEALQKEAGHVVKNFAEMADTILNNK